MMSSRARLTKPFCRSAIFLGGPWFCSIFQLAQRFQIVNSLSPLQAGFRLIPFTLAAPIGSIVSAALAKAAKIPPLYWVIFASVLQVIGFSLLSTVSNSHDIPAAQYGYQVIAGFGCGINISLLLVMVPFRVQDRDKGKYMILNMSTKQLMANSYPYSGCIGLDWTVPCDGRCHWAGNSHFRIQWAYQEPTWRSNLLFRA